MKRELFRNSFDQGLKLGNEPVKKGGLRIEFTQKIQELFNKISARYTSKSIVVNILPRYLIHIYSDYVRISQFEFPSEEQKSKALKALKMSVLLQLLDSIGKRNYRPIIREI